MNFLKLTALVLLITGCGTTRYVEVNSNASQGATYEDVSSSGSVSGVGIESQDIVSMTDKMIRSMLSNPLLVNRNKPARILIDASEFSNESSSRINKNMIIDRIRSSMVSSANGRLMFFSDENVRKVAKLRQMKREGVTDGGTIRKTKAQAGIDFYLKGKITSLDSVHTKSQLTGRYHQITFEMIDAEYGAIVWSGMYEFKKSAQDDIIYR